MNHHNIRFVKEFNKLSPRREYILRYERGQYYEGYDEHWDSNQRLKYSRIYKINHRNKKKRYKSLVMDKRCLKEVLSVLERVEYAGDAAETDYNCCPVCGNIPLNKGELYHEKDCKLSMLIKRIKKLLQEK